MNVVTQDGMQTVTHWWAEMRISGTSITLGSDRDGQRFTLVIARCRTKAKAEALFKALNDGIRNQQKCLDVAVWNKSYVPVKAEAVE